MTCEPALHNIPLLHHKRFRVLQYDLLPMRTGTLRTSAQTHFGFTCVELAVEPAHQCMECLLHLEREFEFGHEVKVLFLHCEQIDVEYLTVVTDHTFTRDVVN